MEKSFCKNKDMAFIIRSVGQGAVTRIFSQQIAVTGC